MSRRVAYDANHSYHSQERGFQVVRAEENQPGYRIVSEGWPSAEAANGEATALNRRIGITEDDRLAVFSSSMAASARSFASPLSSPLDDLIDT